MDQVTCDGLELIFRRHGEEIFWEASRRLLIEVLKSIEYIGGDLPKPWRRMFEELVAEMRKEDAPVRRAKLPAIAA